MILRVLPFVQPDLRLLPFDPEKAAKFETEFGIPFPYERNEDVYVLYEQAVLEWIELCPDGVVRRFKLTFPEGWVCDLSSVPRLLWWVVDRSAMGDMPPLFHDTPYRFKGAVPACWLEIYDYALEAWVKSSRKFSRATTDELYRKIQELDLKRGFVRWASWIGVRANLLANRGWIKGGI